MRNGGSDILEGGIRKTEREIGQGKSRSPFQKDFDPICLWILGSETIKLGSNKRG